ncbi:unnamed protein product [Mytilus edulis]|uniref:Uncharacterized protein n=1 Tax=Mytilus edulis TaxID=6550 RepID=A0A8S3QDX7_MYTED|nr:unnamed protein product [Mytilus edulis]
MKYAKPNVNGIEAITRIRRTCVIYLQTNVNFLIRQYWYRSQDKLLNIQRRDPREFWKNIGKIGVGSERQKTIPMEVVLEDGSICSDTNIILNKWKTSYENLLNCDAVTNVNDNMSNNILNVDLDCEVSIDEVLKVLTQAKNGKAPGIDLIPVELFKNNLLLHVLHKLFNICFKFGKIPSVWSGLNSSTLYLLGL